MATAQTLLQQYLTGFCVLRLDLNEVQETSDGNSKSKQGWQAAPGETGAGFSALSDTDYHMDGKGKFDQGWQAAPVVGGAYTIHLLDKKTALTAAVALARLYHVPQAGSASCSTACISAGNTSAWTHVL